MLVLLCHLLFCLFVFGGCGWFARVVGSYIVGVLGYLCGLILLIAIVGYCCGLPCKFGLTVVLSFWFSRWFWVGVGLVSCLLIVLCVSFGFGVWLLLVVCWLVIG